MRPNSQKKFGVINQLIGDLLSGLSDQALLVTIGVSGAIEMLCYTYT